MRNLLEYPITKTEILAALQEVAAQLVFQDEVLIGDMRPLLLAAASELIEHHFNEDLTPCQPPPSK